jgi:sigma-B regulation protein RsbU (phosphoserine phosphatase)
MPASILVVDDFAPNRRLLETILSREGHEVRTASGGDEALRWAREAPPDLVLLDIRMPDLDGFAVCEALRSDERTRNVPIIFVSSLEDVNERVRGLNAGAEDYITKPFNKEEILARVRTQLRLQELTRKTSELNQHLLRKQEHIEEDLRAAAEIQRALLPRDVSLERLGVAWRFCPCAAVSGDIFNAIRAEEGVAVLYMVDVSGHGVPSALVAVSLAQGLTQALTQPGAAARLARSPAAWLRLLDRDYPIDRFGRHFTITYLVLDSREGHLRFSSAGHPPPVLVPRQGRVRLLEAGGPLIGLGVGYPYDEAEVRLEAGDRVYLYTDGIIEHGDVQGDLFGMERLMELLGEERGSTLEQSCDAVLRALSAFSPTEQLADDVSLLAVEYRPH